MSIWSLLNSSRIGKYLACFTLAIVVSGCGMGSFESQKDESSSAGNLDVETPTPADPSDPNPDPMNPDPIDPDPVDPDPMDPDPMDPDPMDPDPMNPNPMPTGFYEWGERERQRVYISGHSLTVFGFYLDHLARNQSEDHQWNQHQIGGSPIRVRVRNGSQTGFAGWTNAGESKTGQTINFLNEVRSPRTIGNNNRYNALILTDRHDLINVVGWENTIPYIKLYADLFNESSRSRVFFYHAWLDINKSDPQNWINYEKQAKGLWECAAAKVNLQYRNQNSEIRILNIPAGTALVDLVEKIRDREIPGFTEGSLNQRLNQLFSDNVHMTDVGTYYLAALNYIALYGIKPAPTALPSGNLNLFNQAATRNALIDHAWGYMRNYYTSSNNQHTMAQCRSYGQAYCTALNRFNNDNYNNCMNIVNNQFADRMPDWFNLPN